ncbi:dipeptide/oligopeptide/nickel ABC transporter permease/ATP-binding protein [Streptomyces hainanensis]|uniref:Dipeptide/oligopeptide/nickel ABC transporter permease/ATP-binding protein n=1 Tax=Streptomyces hainanensis TaxID=402648 RepID=A0A4R4TQL7_9ACTN|nr:dipeptide/oligopeptide/nickel ABC transporter permease/ATP-binding protein [Streptomyces hainanensis]TDC80507.1 dipeptide/oligopeptide/nickel ABC transporter permease/ATP-binding protein [Streptomyces hainanensis]
MSQQLGALGPDQTAVAPTRRKWRVTRALLRNPMAVGSVVTLAVMTLLCLLAPLITGHDSMYSSVDHVNAPIGTEGWLLGGDAQGRDMWSRLLASISVSLTAALIGTGVAVIIGVVFGLVAGYVGRTIDSIASWVFDLVLALPSLLMLIVLLPVTRGSYQLTMMLLGIMLSPGVYRLVRNMVIGIRRELYIDAAKVAGLSTWRILTRHVFFVVRGPIVIQAAFIATICINVQAGLAFLGVGANTPSFGSMISLAFTNLYGEPIQLVWPTLGLVALTGALILFANAYRDALAGTTTAARRRSRRALADVVKRADEAAPTTEKPTEKALLTVRDLRIAYPRSDGSLNEVVHEVSLTVDSGEIVGLVGESGSGKTQTAFAMLGLLPHEAVVSAKELSLGGRPLLGLTPTELRELRGPDLAYIPQEPMSNLDPSFTVGSQLVEPLRRTMPRAQAKQRVLELLARVGIPDPPRTFHSYPHQISGGMAQRVLIAGAVATQPKVLIADEPTTALDVTVQAEILDLLRELQHELRMGVLLVTHNFGVVADLCDRVVVMRDGRDVETGEVRQIFHHPAHEYTRSLIDSILDEETVRTDAPASRAKEGVR